MGKFEGGRILMLTYFIIGCGNWLAVADNNTSTAKPVPPATNSTTSATSPAATSTAAGGQTTSGSTSTATSTETTTKTTHATGTTRSTGSTPATDGNTTSTTKTTTASKKPSAMSTFDVGSFFGGFVLCAAIVVIIYLGCKVFRTKKPDYNTL